MNPRALAAWSAACLLVSLGTTNPAYRGLALAAAATVAVATAGPGRSPRALILALAMASAGAIVLNSLLSHLGAHVLLTLPAWLPLAGGPVALEGVAYGAAQAMGLAAAVLAVAPWSLALEPHEVVDALPRHLERTGMLLAAALNLVPRIARSFGNIAEAQRFRGWRPRGPASWGEVLVPGVLSAVEDSIQLAEAMDARAFGSGRRSGFAAPSWRAGDTVVVAASAGVALMFAGLRFSGRLSEWHPYPNLIAPALDPAMIAACLLLFIPVLAWRSPA